MATVDTITVFRSSMNVAFFIGVSPRQVAVAHDGRSVRFKYQKVGSDEWRFMTVGGYGVYGVYAPQSETTRPAP